MKTKTLGLLCAAAACTFTSCATTTDPAGVKKSVPDPVFTSQLIAAATAAATDAIKAYTASHTPATTPAK